MICLNFVKTKKLRLEHYEILSHELYTCIENHLSLVVDEDVLREDLRLKIGARITGCADRVGAHREISDIRSARRIEAVKFICHAVVRRVRPVCREGNNNDTST